MSILMDLLFMMMYLYILFCFQFPNINNECIIMQKVGIFLIIFGFYFVIQIMEKLKHNCKLMLEPIIKNCLIISLAGSLGFAIFENMRDMNMFSPYIGDITRSKYLLYLCAVLIMMLVISIIKIIDCVLTKQDPCVKNKENDK